MNNTHSFKRSAKALFASCMVVAMWSGLAAHTWAADLEARLAWAGQVDLSPQVSGMVKSVVVSAGQRVSKGEALVHLDSREFQARLQGAQAQVNAGKAVMDEAQREVERGEELYDRGALSGMALDQRRVALSQAKGEFGKAVAARDLAKLDVERSSLLAPFDARVMAINTVPGVVVITRFKSQPLLTLVADGRMRAKVQVDADQVSRIEPGQAITVVAGNREYAGRVVVLGVAPAATGLYPLEVEFDHPSDHALRAGQSVTLRLP